MCALESEVRVLDEKRVDGARLEFRTLGRKFAIELGRTRPQADCRNEEKPEKPVNAARRDDWGGADRQESERLTEIRCE